ncbi:MAG: hypothetical protein ACREI6_03245 [Candidatus Rokuibacteriota bacterium]
MSRISAVLTLGLCLAASPAVAVEYRLEVASLYREAFAHYFDGPIASGPGERAMSRLEKDLDEGRTERSVVLSDRTLRYGWEAVARSFEATKVIAEVKPLESPRRWDEVVWEGKPGERSVWVIAPSSRHFQEVYHVAVKGAEPGAGLHYYVPDRVALRGRPQTVVGYPLSLLRFYEGRSDLWHRYLSKSLDLGKGIAVVVGVGDNPTFPDWTYIVVEQPPSPTTFKVVLGWQRREAPEAPSLENRDP